MGRSFGFIALIIVVGIGGYIYTRQAHSVSAIGKNPETAVDVIAVRNDLFAIANAEKRYYALNSKYASVAELRSNGDINIPSREHYSYTVESTDNTFNIVARYTGSDSAAPKRISINDRMALTTE
jgi:pectate lyase